MAASTRLQGQRVSTNTTIELKTEAPELAARLHLPAGGRRPAVAGAPRQARRRQPLTPDEQAEAKGLVEMAELLVLLRLRISESTRRST
jgi:hypothetical protein